MKNHNCLDKLSVFPPRRNSRRPLWIMLAMGMTLSTMLGGCGDSGKEHGSGPLTVEDFKGYTLYVNYWAEWCQPCREEVPELNAFQKKYKDSVRVVGVNFDRLKGKTLAGQVEKLGIDFPSLDVDPRSALDVPVPIGLPETFVINAEGKLVSILRGPQTIAALENALALAEEGESVEQSP